MTQGFVSLLMFSLVVCRGLVWVTVIGRRQLCRVLSMFDDTVTFWYYCIVMVWPRYVLVDQIFVWTNVPCSLKKYISDHRYWLYCIETSLIYSIIKFTQFMTKVDSISYFNFDLCKMILSLTKMLRKKWTMVYI